MCQSHHCHLLINLICNHTCLSHLSTLANFLPTWPVIICLYPTSLPLSPPYQSDLSPYVSITTLYLCHLRINLICHHTCLCHTSTLATFLSTSSVIICVYSTYISLSHSYQLDLSLYMAIPHIYTWHFLINLICHHMCLFYISTLVTFFQFDLSSDVSIPHIYPFHLIINLTCHHYVSIPQFYTFLLLIKLICHHMCLSHLSNFVISWSIWSVIIYGYPHLHLCHLLINLSLPYIIYFVTYLFVSSLFILRARKSVSKLAFSLP